MRDQRPQPIPPGEVASAVPAVPFAWRGGGVVLLGDLEGDRWVLARGWLRADTLTDVRRWSFADPVGLSRQVRRLVLEAIGDPVAARAQGDAALAWTECQAVGRRA